MGPLPVQLTPLVSIAMPGSDGDGTQGLVSLDVTGDGLMEFAMGAPRARGHLGQVLVFDAPFVESTAAEDADWVLEGSGDLGFLGGALDAGDVTGDGGCDLLIGEAGGFENGAGAAWLVDCEDLQRGTTLGVADVATLRVGGVGDPMEISNAGESVQLVSDVDGDGLMELVVGAPSADEAGPSDAGAVAMVLSDSARDGGHLPWGDAHMRWWGSLENESVGGALAGLGDLNGDGLGELVVGGCTRTGDPCPEGGGAWLLMGAPW